MDFKKYRAWLDAALADKATNYRKDLVSRAKRVENAFQELDKDFSLDKEYEKDKGESIIKKLEKKGQELDGTRIKLPVLTDQMRVFVAAAKMYFRYLNDTKDNKK